MVRSARIHDRRPAAGLSRITRRGVLIGIGASLVASLAPLHTGTADETWLGYDLDNPDLVLLNRRNGLRILDARGEFLAARGAYYGPPVPYRNLPRHLVHALIAKEDKRFYHHDGLDGRGLARAAVSNLTSFDVKEGGSTLTQQTLKEIFLRDDHKIVRKLKEWALANGFEESRSKQEILFLYLNRVFFGGRAYGIEAAARVYFGKYAHNLTIMESAMLVGILHGPNAWNPHKDFDHTIGHAHEVLDKMVEHEGKFLSKAAADAAKRQRPKVAEKLDVGGGFHRVGPHIGWFAQWIEAEARKTGKIGPGVSTIKTSLDLRLQRIAARSLGQALARHGKASNVDQGAVVVMAPDGKILAMVGGRDLRSSQWNNAVQAKRQPGSAFKLFVYLAALEGGLRPTDLVSDEPLNLPSGPIRNFDDRYRGRIRLEAALASSSNVAAVRIAMSKASAIKEVARRLGLTTNLATEPGAIALGSNEVTLLELTAAYAVIANGGMLSTPSAILEIRDNFNAVCYASGRTGPTRVVQPEHARAMRDMLALAVRKGTGAGADPGFWAAGKTGTTDDYRDAWFIGFTEHYVAGVWLGNERRAPMNGVAGGGLPARIWADIMRNATRQPA